jgi:hypothetical protein
VTWLVAENDSYFSPEFSKKMADAFIEAGDDKVDFRVLPVFGNEGHWLAEAGEPALIDSILANALGLNVQAPMAQGVSAKKK